MISNSGRWLLLALCFFVSSQSLAFRSSKCFPLYKPVVLPQEKKKGFAYKALAYTVEIPRIIISAPVTSGVSFFSSTGQCSAIAKNELERKEFIALSFEKIQTEASRGAGEDLETLSVLYGCPLESDKEFSQMMKINYAAIFSGLENRDADLLHDQIMESLLAEPHLRTQCLL